MTEVMDTDPTRPDAPLASSEQITALGDLAWDVLSAARSGTEVANWDVDFHPASGRAELTSDVYVQEYDFLVVPGGIEVSRRTEYDSTAERPARVVRDTILLAGPTNSTFRRRARSYDDEGRWSSDSYQPQRPLPFNVAAGLLRQLSGILGGVSEEVRDEADGFLAQLLAERSGE